MEVENFTIEIIEPDGSKQLEEIKDYREAVSRVKFLHAHDVEIGESREINIRRPADGADGFVYYSTLHNDILKSYEELGFDDYAMLLGNGKKPSNNQSVYIDIDGTAAYWHNDGKGLSYPEQILDFQYHYYRDLEPHQFIVDLAKQLIEKGYDVCILSATGREVLADRFEWIENNMPFIPKENIFVCPIGADKTKFCKGNAEMSVLIDDYNGNLKKWTGEAIKSVNTINSKNEKFANLPTAYAESLLEYDDQYLDCYETEIERAVNLVEESLEKCRLRDSEINYNEYDEYAELGE